MNTGAGAVLTGSRPCPEAIAAESVPTGPAPANAETR